MNNDDYYSLEAIEARREARAERMQVWGSQQINRGWNMTRIVFAVFILLMVVSVLFAK